MRKPSQVMAILFDLPSVTRDVRKKQNTEFPSEFSLTYCNQGVARGLSPPPKDVLPAKPPHRKQYEQPSPTNLKILAMPLSARLVLETDDWNIVNVYDSNYETIGSLLCWILFIDCDSWVCSLMSSTVRGIGNFSLWLIQ